MYLEFLCSIIYGYVTGIIGSFTLKLNRDLVQKTNKAHAVYETLTLFIVGVIGYNISEKEWRFGGNGAATIVVYAVTIRNYGWYNISVKGIICSRYIL
jgi:H+/Cl- antiporter ClcA